MKVIHFSGIGAPVGLCGKTLKGDDKGTDKYDLVTCKTCQKKTSDFLKIALKLGK